MASYDPVIEAGPSTEIRELHRAYVAYADAGDPEAAGEALGRMFEIHLTAALDAGLVTSQELRLYAEVLADKRLGPMAAQVFREALMTSGELRGRFAGSGMAADLLSDRRAEAADPN